MADITKTAIDRYINAVGHEMTCSGKRKHTLLNRLRGDVEEFADICGDHFDETAIESHFGKPKDVAAGFLETTDFSEVKKKVSTKKMIVICVVIACIITLLGIFGYIAFDNWRKENFINGHAEETPVYNVEEIPDEVLNPPEGTRTY